MPFNIPSGYTISALSPPFLPRALLSEEMKPPPTATPKPSKRRLLFDRRYGWVVDEWKDPSSEALAGGRGMFCILPLAKTLLQMASHSINVAAGSLVRVIEKPDLLSPQALKTNLDDQVQKLLRSIQRPNLNLLLSSRNSSMVSVGLLQPMQDEKVESTE